MKTLLRISLAIAFGFIGAFVAKSGTPPEIFAITGRYFLVIAIFAFGILGFILPELIELLGKAGISALAIQIVRYLPPGQGFPVPFSFSRRRKTRPGKYVNPLIVDTSVFIDGRIVDVVKTGFIFGTFLVIPSVVGELHLLSDSADDIKRARGKRGLEVLLALQGLRLGKHLKVEVLESEPKDGGVDEKLVTLAKKIGAKILTVDYNLNKVAKVKKVQVLNINELANAVKTAVLPNERLQIRVDSLGREKSQGVGYLSDGTMVVIEGGSSFVGKTIPVKVLRILQTAAGKMIFARSADEKQ